MILCHYLAMARSGRTLRVQSRRLCLPVKSLDSVRKITLLTPVKAYYLDNITREELSAIDFKNVLTEGKLTQEQVAGLDNAMQTHYFVGSEVRKAIEAVHRPMPEDLPSAPSIRKMVEERGRTRRKQLRGKEQRDQETLF